MHHREWKSSHKTNTNPHSENSPQQPLKHILPNTTITLIHNPSKPLTLIEEEFIALIKGLSFALAPTKAYKQEITKSWSKFKTGMLKQYFIWNSIQEKLAPFKKESNWIPRTSDNYTLVSLFTCVEQELGSFNNTLWTPTLLVIIFWLFLII